MPVEREIDALGGGKTVRDREARVELVYQNCKDENVTLVGGVCPTTIKFARCLRRTHTVYPKDLWQTQIMTLGSVPGINTKYQPALNAKRIGCPGCRIAREWLPLPHRLARRCGDR
jgi:hypothetical protein